jgi:hypothetical protein
MSRFDIEMRDAPPVSKAGFYVVDEEDKNTGLFNDFPQTKMFQMDFINSTTDDSAIEFKTKYHDLYEHITKRIQEGKMPISVNDTLTDADLEQLVSGPLTKEQCDNWLSNGIISETAMSTLPEILQQVIECLNARIAEDTIPTSNKAISFASRLAAAIAGIHDYPSLSDTRDTVIRILADMISTPDLQNTDVDLYNALSQIQYIFKRDRLYSRDNITISQVVCRRLIRNVYDMLGVKVDSDIMDILKLRTEIFTLTSGRVDILNIMQQIKAQNRLAPISPGDNQLVKKYLNENHPILDELCVKMSACGSDEWNLVLVSDAFKNRPLWAIFHVYGIIPKLFEHDALGPHLRDVMSAMIPSGAPLHIVTRFEPYTEPLDTPVQPPELSSLIGVYFRHDLNVAFTFDPETRAGFLPIQWGVFGIHAQWDEAREALTYIPLNVLLKDLNLTEDIFDRLLTEFIAYLATNKPTTYKQTLMKYRYVQNQGLVYVLASTADYTNKVSVDAICNVTGVDAVRGSIDACAGRITNNYRPPESVVGFYINKTHQNKRKSDGENPLTKLKTEIVYSDKQSGDLGKETLATELGMVSQHLASVAPVVLGTGDLSYRPFREGFLCMTSTTVMELRKHVSSVSKTPVVSESLQSTLDAIISSVIVDMRTNYNILREKQLLTESENLFVDVYAKYKEEGIRRWFNAIYIKDMLTSVNDRHLDRSFLFRFPPGVETFCSLLAPQLIDIKDLFELIMLDCPITSHGLRNDDYILNEIIQYASECSIAGTESLRDELNKLNSQTFSEYTGYTRPPSREMEGLKQLYSRNVSYILTGKIQALKNDLATLQRTESKRAKIKIEGGRGVDNKIKKTRKHIKTRYGRKKIKMTHKKHTKSDKRGTRKKNIFLYPSMSKSGTVCSRD